MTLVLKQTTFEGPLDLLLSLIESEALDITTVALGQVTDQYLAYVRGLERSNLSQISDYLVIAARLVLIKSRAILPGADEEAEEDADDLAAQLREYKRIKEAAARLGARLADGAFSVGKRPAELPRPAGAVTEGVDLAGLHRAFQEVLERMPTTEPIPEETLEEQLTLEECIDLVRRRVHAGPVPFRSLFDRLRSRLQMIVTFLAVLELIKQSVLRVRTDDRQLTLVAA